ncbi:hypothetical protein EYF80_052482 [Liparis tanakae]|uniref:Uncharacterized protein n=1 Tax=Liparis tanakae TaxID=230148 RepID=A0A4Z2F880_9TELE|nr:hypothetical protein EYF80_052482 [Liparis tanakae]
MAVVGFDHASVSLAPQTGHVDLRLGHVAPALPLALAGGVPGQPGLSGVFPPHVAQIRLHRARQLGPEIRLEHRPRSYDLTTLASGGWTSVCVPLSHLVTRFPGKLSPGWSCNNEESVKPCRQPRHRSPSSSANFGVRADAGELLVESEELDEFGEELGFLRHLSNEVAWAGGERQGGVSGAEDVELLLVFQNPNQAVHVLPGKELGLRGDEGPQVAGDVAEDAQQLGFVPEAGPQLGQRLEQRLRKDMA